MPPMNDPEPDINERIASRLVHWTFWFGMWPATMACGLDLMGLAPDDGRIKWFVGVILVWNAIRMAVEETR